MSEEKGEPAVIPVEHSWARGATTTPVTIPGPPVLNYPDSYSAAIGADTSGSHPSGGRRLARHARWAIGITVAVAIIAAGLGGWMVRGADTGRDQARPSPAAAATAQASPVPGSAPISQQAAKQTCGTYEALGVQWDGAYKEWLHTLPDPWSWTDPAVQQATSKFDTTGLQIAAQISQNIQPNTPNDLADAVQQVRAEMVNLAASNLQAADSKATIARIRALNAAMNIVDELCRRAA